METSESENYGLKLHALMLRVLKDPADALPDRCLAALFGLRGVTSLSSEHRTHAKTHLFAEAEHH